jgi:hypothetical protein
MWAHLLAPVFASAELFDAIEILKEYGPYCGLLVIAVTFFLWRDMRREDQLTRRIVILETENRDTLIPLLKETTAVIARNTSVMERLERHLDH